QEARQHAPALLLGLIGWSAIALLSATSARRGVPAAVVVAALATAPLLADATRLVLRRPTTALGEYHLAEADSRTVVLTNVAGLPPWLARNGGEPSRIHHMPAADQRYEPDILTNERVGQREAAY